MKTLLQIDSSLFSQHGQSSQLASAFTARWSEQNPGGRVVTRDLARQEIPHLTAERFQAFLAKPGERTPEQHAVAGFSDALIEELRQADVIVLGLPLYNFGVPSQLKAYFDHVARAGITFRYTANGPEGLLTGKKAYVFATRGGVHAGKPQDTQTPYVRDFLAFLGITEVEFIFAEGLAMGDAPKAEALAAAQDAITRIAAGAALAA
jgi:FMN-dependent NADH-azoreductase